MANEKAYRAGALTDAVVALWLKTGSPVLPKDAASFLGWSETTVRKHANEAAIRWTDEYVPVTESNYGTVRCHRKVLAYLPSMGELRRRLLEHEKPEGGE